MKTPVGRLIAGLLTLVVALTFGQPPGLFAQTAAASKPSGPPDDRWPRKFTAGGNAVNLYTPHLDSWDGRTIEWHAAVSITAPGAKEPTFGVLFATAKTDVDKTTRLVELSSLQITKVTFPSAPAANDTYLAMLRHSGRLCRHVAY